MSDGRVERRSCKTAGRMVTMPVRGEIRKIASDDYDAGDADAEHGDADTEDGDPLAN